MIRATTLERKLRKNSAVGVISKLVRKVPNFSVSQLRVIRGPTEGL